MTRATMLILNRPAVGYMQGGNVREYALAQWSAANGAEIYIIQDGTYHKSRMRRWMALPILLLRLWRTPKANVLLGYPGFPFFWSLDSVAQLLRPVLFVVMFKLVGCLRRQRIVVDVMDLPRLQHTDLDYPVGLPKWLFKFFDRMVYHLATELWICSAGIAEIIRQEMYWGRKRVKVVENGAFPSDHDDAPAPTASAPQVFIYAGQLFAARGVPELVEQFARCRRTDVELRLCGVGGEWIPKTVADHRVKHLGRLTEDECARAVAESDVGIVYQPRGPYYDIVFPTKLPLYVARGKPVLATNNPELARAVKEKGVGLVVSADAISECIDSLDAETMTPYARRAHQLQREAYWSTIYDKAFDRLNETE